MDEIPFQRISLVDKSQVSRAIKALYVLASRTPEKNKPNLLAEDGCEATGIQLTISLKRIPDVNNKWLQLHVDHSPFAPTQQRQVCLFVKDIEGKDSDATVEFYRRLLGKEDIKGISEVIPHRVLATEYKPYEAKIRLCRMFDVFLADRSIYHRLPTMLGKAFFKANKVPIGVNVSARQAIKSEIEAALGSVPLLMTGRGDCMTCRVANTALPVDSSIDNVMGACQSFVEQCPRGWANIRSLYLRLGRPDTISLPVYQSQQNLASSVEDSSLFSETTLKSSEVSDDAKPRKRVDSLADTPPVVRGPRVAADTPLAAVPRTKPRATKRRNPPEESELMAKVKKTLVAGSTAAPRVTKVKKRKGR